MATLQQRLGGDLNRTRAEVIACAKRWVADEIPYCQCDGAQECCGSCPYCGTYRCDCSGYVTACYELHKPHNTVTLTEEFHRIEHHELKPGTRCAVRAVLRARCEFLLLTGREPVGR